MKKYEYEVHFYDLENDEEHMLRCETHSDKQAAKITEIEAQNEGMDRIEIRSISKGQAV